VIGSLYFLNVFYDILLQMILKKVVVPPAEHLINPSDTSSTSTEQNMNTECQEDKTTDFKKLDSKPNFKSTSEMILKKVVSG
jgi:hypothetical protein